MVETVSESVSALGNEEQSGLFFLPTRGPGNSEGGEIYAPAIEVRPSERSGSTGNDAPGAD
jgi:hypothetical protein